MTPYFKVSQEVLGPKVSTVGQRETSNPNKHQRRLPERGWGCSGPQQAGFSFVTETRRKAHSTGRERQEHRLERGRPKLQLRLLNTNLW